MLRYHVMTLTEAAQAVRELGQDVSVSVIAKPQCASAKDVKEAAETLAGWLEELFAARNAIDEARFAFAKLVRRSGG